MGTDSFFGGLLGGVGEGLLRKEQQQTQQKMIETQQRTNLWQLVYSNKEIPDDLKAKFGEMLFQPPAPSGGIGGAVKKAVGRGGKQAPQVDPKVQVFKTLNQYYQTQKDKPAQGGQPGAQPGAEPTATLGSVPPVGQPEAPAAQTPPTSTPPFPPQFDLSTEAGRESQEQVQVDRAKADVKFAESEREFDAHKKRVLEDFPTKDSPGYFKALYGVDVSTKPDSIDQSMGEALKKHQSGDMSDAKFEAFVGDVHKLMSAKEKPPTETVEKQEMDDWLKKHPGKGPAEYQEHAKAIGPTVSFNLQSGQSGGGGNGNSSKPQATGEAALAKLNPRDAGIVKALADGRMTLPSSFALRTPYWQRMLGNLMQYDPQFSEQRAQVRKAFTTGTDGKNIGSLNTAAVHLDTLGEAAKALATGNFRPGNEVYLQVKTMFGDSAPTSFEGVRDAVSGEMAAALKGNATDIEIENIRKGINAKNSPKQLADYIDMQMHILHQKLDTYRQRYEQQIPNDTVYSPVLPQAKQVFEKHGVKAGEGLSGVPQVGQGAAGMTRIKASDGTMHDIPVANLEKAKQIDPKLQVMQ